MRNMFIDNAELVHTFISRPEVAERWDEPSALDQMSIGTLTAHLTRACTTVLTYLDAPTDAIPADADPVTGGQYFATVMGVDEEHLADLNKSVVERAAGESADGFEAVRDRMGATIATLRTRFAEVNDDHVVAVFGAMPMRLDEYLKTRCVETVVHADDLAVSLGVDPPDFDQKFVKLAIATMVDTATELNGATAVVRAVARAERATLPVFPVF